MQMLASLFVPQEQDYISPFDTRVPGFRSGWWGDYFQNTIDPDHRPYSFTDHTGAEAARALLREHAGFTNRKIGISLPPRAVAVDFIEVREDLYHPRQGVGTRVVRLIEAIYPDVTLFAFSEGADQFWGSTGWEFIPRADGDDRPRPLFVLRREGDGA
ncbi:hypothetical protein [Microbacterium sp. NPDC091662]|uniref:hypothetical protein n=1 Tax=Microbacterium sp. NPDC091662 TaxID=3364211 RepID=UPI003813D906